MRIVVIRVDGAKHPIRKMQLREGTRVSDILQELNVPKGYVLTREAEPRHPFPHEAEVHDLIATGEYLLARSNAPAVGNTPAFTLSFSNEEEQYEGSRTEGA